MMIAAVSFAHAQSARMVLIEEATNASCGPCAAQNPGFHTLLSANTENVTAIKYQVWWPGFDPMYEDNEADVDVRVPYYGIQGAPSAVIDGVTPNSSYPGFISSWYAGAPGGITQASLNHASGFDSPFDIELSYEITPIGITIDATATCTEAVSGNLRLHVVVVEETIEFETAPGSNGETEFHNVMKKMLPSAQGSSMENSYDVGDTYSTSQSWTFANVYNVEEIAVVAFIQDNTSKAVHQAAFLNNVELQPAFTVDASPIAITGIQDFICESSVSPTVQIRNFGGDELTSATISYELNDASGTIEWTGNLEFWETANIELGEIEFTPESSNQLVVTISNPNGVSDENTTNDAAEVEVSTAADATTVVTVEIQLDSYPGETTWEITDEGGNVVADGGPYNGQGGQTIEVDVTLPALGCYAFLIEDSYGDGLNGGAWTGGYDGFYTVTSDGNVVASGGGAEQWSQELTGMNVNSVQVSTNDYAFEGTVSLFPNPTKDISNIQLSLETGGMVRYDVFDISGKRVLSESKGQLAPGEYLHSIDVASLNSGLYFVTISVGESQITKKLSVY